MKWKRVTAMAGVILIAGLYISALAAALIGSPASRDFLMAAIFCTVAVPIMIYAYQMIGRIIKRTPPED